MLLEQTTPYDSFEGALCASGGGNPGGVDGLGNAAMVGVLFVRRQ